MWIFTKYGFYSFVCARQGEGGYHEPVDPDRIMVRCRLKAHLVALKGRFPDLLGDCEIMEFSGTDYAFRIFLEKPLWSKVLACLNDELDYDNFKSSVGLHQGDAGSDYVHSLHKVWEVMHRLQNS